MSKLEVGKTYLTQDGTPVTITEHSVIGNCVCGSDDLWRYSHGSHCGRVTGSNFDYSHPKNFEKDCDGNFYEVNLTGNEPQEESTMNTATIKYDYTLLRPFDLEAAKRGEPVRTRDGFPAKFVAHLPECREEERVIVVIKYDGNFLGPVPYHYYENGSYHYTQSSSNDLFMSPLFWLEGKPVYAGDKLLHKHDAYTIVVHHLNASGAVCQEGSNIGNWIANLSWPPVEEWVAFDPETAKIGDKVRVKGYGEGVVVLGSNQQGEFVFDIADYGYLVVGDGYEVQPVDVTVMKTL